VTKKKVVRKKAAAKKRGAASGRPSTSSRPRALKKKKASTKKKLRGNARKPTKAERRATHSTRRKPETNKKEAREYFGAEDRRWTPRLRAELKRVFLRAYATSGIILDGTVAADISRDTYKKWRREDEAFDAGCEEAKQMADDLLEREAVRRGMNGFDRPVIYQGEITDYYTDYSDSLLQTLLKGNRPSKFKERTEHSTPKGQPMEVDVETRSNVMSTMLGMIQSKKDLK